MPKQIEARPNWTTASSYNFNIKLSDLETTQIDNRKLHE